LLLLAPLFFATSFIYSSAGFAGGSSYVAILVLVGINLYTIPPISLALNIVVSSAALFNFFRAGHLSLRFTAPLLVSIPFAFVTGTLVLPELTLTFVFIVALFTASGILLLSGNSIKNRQVKVRKMNLNFAKKVMITAPLGAVLGSIAGLVGIGGGIWLSPILIITGMASPKKAAASASLFILANSISSFLAHSVTKKVDLELIIPLAIVVLAGGLLGSRLGAFKFSHDKLVTIIGIIVAVAGINLVVKLFT
jgi:uncharacterized protein